MCADILTFCGKNGVPMKFTTVMKILKEVNSSRINIQLGISEAQRKAIYKALYLYIQSIGTSCQFNIALPYKLLTSIARNDKKATSAYLGMYKEIYTKEFLQLYLVSFVLL
mgnify:CR=1 FL=1